MVRGLCSQGHVNFVASLSFSRNILYLRFYQGKSFSDILSGGPRAVLKRRTQWIKRARNFIKQTEADVNKDKKLQTDRFEMRLAGMRGSESESETGLAISQDQLMSSLADAASSALEVLDKELIAMFDQAAEWVNPLGVPDQSGPQHGDTQSARRLTSEELLSGLPDIADLLAKRVTILELDDLTPRVQQRLKKKLSEVENTLRELLNAIAATRATLGAGTTGHERVIVPRGRLEGGHRAMLMGLEDARDGALEAGYEDIEEDDEVGHFLAEPLSMMALMMHF